MTIQPMMKKIAITLCAVTIASVVFAGDKAPAGKQALNDCSLKLSAEQRKKRNLLDTEFRENMIQLAARKATAEVRIDSILDADQPDYKALRVQTDTISTIYDAMLQHRVSALEAINGMLTPAQIKSYQCRMNFFDDMTFEDLTLDETFIEEIALADDYGYRTHPLLEVNVPIDAIMETPFDMLYN